MLYGYQTAKPYPDALDLDEKSFYYAGVGDRERQSESIFIALDDGQLDSTPEHREVGAPKTQGVRGDSVVCDKNRDRGRL